MNITVLQENLIKALTHASRIITTKAQMPILSHIKLDADKQGLMISSTDLEIGLRLRVGAKVDQPGSITVPSRVITELINNAGPGALQLTVTKEELSIQGGGLKASVAGMSPEEFPTLPPFPDQSTIELPADHLTQAINKVGFAAATDDSRPVLTAIQVKAQDSHLELAGTDGFRLSWVKLSHAQAANSSKSEKTSKEKKPQEWLIPARALQEITRLITPNVKQIKLGLTDKSTQVIFQLGDIELISRLVSGEFPDFHKIMPDSGDTVVEMSRSALLRAMRLAAIFARESANIVRFTIQKDQLIISANAPQVGGQESTVDAKVDGPEAQIAFNYRYVLDYLNCGDSSAVQLLMTNALGPGLWLEINPSTKQSKNEITSLDFKHVIMPVRVETTQE